MGSVIHLAFAVFQGISNGGQRSSNRKARVTRWSDLLYNGTVWRFDRLLIKNWRPRFEVTWKTAKALNCGDRGESCHRLAAGSRRPRDPGGRPRRVPVGGHGVTVQVDPINPTLKAPGTQRLKPA